MKINDVKHHIGQEAALNAGERWRHNVERVRIDEVITITDKFHDSWGEKERKHREVKVTILDPETGEEVGRTKTVLAKEIGEPWAEYWERGRELRERSALVAAARERIEKALAKAFPNASFEVRPDYKEWIRVTAPVSDIHDLAAVLESVNL